MDEHTLMALQGAFLVVMAGVVGCVLGFGLGRGLLGIW